MNRVEYHQLPYPQFHFFEAPYPQFQHTRKKGFSRKREKLGKEGPAKAQRTQNFNLRMQGPLHSQGNKYPSLDNAHTRPTPNLCTPPNEKARPAARWCAPAPLPCKNTSGSFAALVKVQKGPWPMHGELASSVVVLRLARPHCLFC